MKSRALNLFLLLICFKGCISFEILGLFPTAAQSHYLVGSALMKRLADAGHQVTVYSKFKLPEPVKNYKEIILSNVEVDPIGEDLYQEDQKSLLSKLGSLSKIGKRISNETVSDPVFQELLQSDRHFDLVIMEVFHTHALLGLGQHFNAPVVVMTTFGDTIWTTQLVGSPSPAAFVPNPSLEFTHNMKFKERLQNTFYSFAEYLILHYRTYPQQERYYLIAFPEAKKTFQEVIKSDVSLVLQNTHFSLNYPRPLMPNVIEVGGIQIERTPKPLPQDLQTILDSAENGAIYFSMGSILKATLMSAEKLQAIVSAFARVNLTVLCTWEGDFDSELVRPENVITRKWLPQNSVLAHPNVRLMITHGGLLSMTEATFHGIPVIGLTVNADQRLNVERAKVAGFARMIPYNRLTANVLHETIEEILADNSFAENATLASAIYRDQPMTPLETAVYWVEYVARHKGAPQLQSPSAKRFGIWKYYSLDVITSAGAILMIILFILWTIVRGVRKQVFAGGRLDKGRRNWSALSRFFGKAKIN